MIPTQEPDWWEKWMVFNEERGQMELRLDAPDNVQKEYRELMRLSMPEFIDPDTEE